MLHQNIAPMFHATGHSSTVHMHLQLPATALEPCQQSDSVVPVSTRLQVSQNSAMEGRREASRLSSCKMSTRNNPQLSLVVGREVAVHVAQSVEVLHTLREVMDHLHACASPAAGTKQRAVLGGGRPFGQTLAQVPACYH